MEKPKIRFRKFNNKWKKNKLDKVVDFFDNRRIPIDSSERKSGPYPYYGASGIIDYVDDYIFSGEYVLLAEDGANIILRSSPIAYLSKGKFWLNNHAHIMRMKTGSNEFLIQLLEKQNYEKYNTGTAQPKLNGEVVKKISLHFPSDEEQSAIGSLFRTLDDLMASYKDNLANYQSLKATMLSRMFPKAGQTVPEIRLDGFEGEWENKILSEVTNITMGQSPKSENYTDNPNDYILVQGNADIKDKQVVPRLWTTEVTKIAEIGDIILTVRAPVGDIGKTDYNVVIGRGVAAIKGNDFIFYTLEKMKMTGFWNKFSTGSTFESISSNDIKEAIIQIPTLPEQQAIGAYFSNLDNCINSFQEKISQLETLKKKLLQDMFI